MKADTFFIQEMVEKMNSFESRIRALEEKIATQPKHDGGVAGYEEFSKKKLSVKEFLIKSAPSGDVSTCLYIGYYLEKHGNIDSFTVSDLRGGFGDAKIKSPGNINDTINRNIAKAFMMCAKEKKDNKTAWVLTASGEKHIEDALKGKVEL